MDETLQALDDLISQFLSLDRSLWSSSDDAEAFLEAVDELTSTIHGLESTSADHALLESFDLLLERCSARLKDEFQRLVGTSGFSDDDHGDRSSKRSQNEDANDHTFVAQPVRNFDIIVDALPEGVVAEANRIATRMIAAGFGDTCAETYASARRSFIDESIARLGVDAHWEEEELCNKSTTAWEELETRIMRWIPATRVVFHILIPSERHLCDCIFEGFTSYADLAFATACRPFLQPLSFAEAIAAAAGHRPESLFRMVDMYDALTDILPVLDEALDHEVVAAPRERLGLSIKGIFVALEKLIRGDPCESSPPDGGLHPITRYVMNYLMAACVSRHTLEEVMLVEFGRADETCPVDPDRPTSSLAICFAWIVDVLIANLESKSRIYGHAPLGCVFLINNGIYIIKKVSGCELKILLGEDWTRVMSAKVHQWVLEYRRATWGRAVAILETDRRPGSSSSSVMLEKLNRFHTFLEAICQVQSRWVLVDKQQAVDLSVMVEELVAPVYRDTVEMLKATEDVGVSYVRPEDVKSRIQRLFKAMAKS